MTCGFFRRLWHGWKRDADRKMLTLPLIKVYPDVFERREAWQIFMDFPDSYYWRCECSREAKHPMMGVPLKELS